MIVLLPAVLTVSFLVQQSSFSELLFSSPVPLLSLAVIFFSRFLCSGFFGFQFGSFC